jgi:VCBS repeat-containing protein
MVAALKANYVALLDDASEDEFEFIPNDSGRQKAVAIGVLEIKKFFGEFTSEADLIKAVDHQVSVEYNKYVFIQAIDNAGDVAAMVKALKDYAGILSDQRQDLIEAWGAVTGNAELAARVDQLEADLYTVVLKEVADRLNNPKFLQDLATKLLVARGDAGGKFNGVVTIVDAIDENMDIAVPAAPVVALANDTGTAGDKITRDGTLNVTGTEEGATVEYSTDGNTWSNSFEAEEGENTVYVRQTDAAGNVSAPTTFTFTLDTAAPEVPSPLALAENADGTTTPVEVATLGTDEDTTFTITGGADEELFNIVDGKLVYVGGALDFESETDQKSFVLKITAVDEAGNTEEHDVTVNLTNVNEAPVAAATGNSASGNEDTVISGSVPAGSDVDAGDSLKYELVASVAGLTLNDNGTFSYTPAANFNGVVEFQYRVVDEDGAKSAPQTFKLTVKAVNDTPWDITLSANQIVENSKTGAEVGKLTGSDYDGEALTFTLVDNAGGRFVIDDKGSLRVANDYALDFERATSHTVKVQVKDSAGTTYEESFTVNVTDDTSETVTGTATADVITGGAGKDVFNGGLGNDKLAGGLGNDTLSGGKGKDAFVFDSKLGTSSTDRKVNFDKITDFSVKDASLYLDNAIFKKLGSGTPTSPKQLSKSFFTIGNKANDKNDYLIYNDKTGVLSYDADGSGKGKAVEFAQLSKNLALTNKDFFVI